MGIFTGNNGEVFIIDLPNLPERPPTSGNVSISPAVKDAFRLKRQEELERQNRAAFESVPRNNTFSSMFKLFEVGGFRTFWDDFKNQFPSLSLQNFRGTLVSTVVLIVVAVFVVMFLLTFVQRKATNLAGG